MSPQSFTNQPFSAVVTYFISAVNTYVSPIIIALAVLVFMWGIFQFVRASDNEDQRKEGRAYMLYGIIGIFVMISLWGFVRILTNTFDIPFGLPQFKSSMAAEVAMK